jgi:mannobiose 2-epimerase
VKLWNYTKNAVVDTENGEWFWKVDSSNNPDPNDEKAGFWKCPYHNSRACLEVIERLSKK